MGDYHRGDSIENYDVYESLGCGGFAQVFRARQRSTGMEVAIKMIDRKLMEAKGMVDRVQQEINIHHQLKHPSVLELYTSFYDDRKVYLVLELCRNGELQKYLKEKKTALSEDAARHILKQVVDGLLYLHEKYIIHRDITLTNLLLTENMHVKIADFGLATQLTDPNEKHKTMCGTPNYISPEIATRASHGLETDVWGLGVMLYTVLVGKPPFDTEDGIKSTLTLVAMTEIVLPLHLSAEVRDLMTSLLKKNPKDRIKLSKIMGHPFMTRNSYISSDSSRWGSHDSGVASSSCLTSKSYSYSNTNSVVPINSNIFSQRPHQLAASWSKPLSASSRPPSFNEIPPLQPPISSSTANPSGISNSYCSMSSGHMCPSTPAPPGQGSWRNSESVSRCQPPLGSGGIPASTGNNLRCHSNNNIQSAPYTENNCSHAWRQCNQQCSHLETCGCLHNRNFCTKGCSSTCVHSNVNYSGCMNVNQTEPVKHMPPVPLQIPEDASKESEIVRNLRELQIRPLSTKRLEPIRQKTKQAILNVLDTGEACLEFIKIKHKVEKVVEVLRISSDGLRIVIYYPNKGKGVPPASQPPPFPPGGADAIYSFESIPEKHLKKYSYASRFVDLVKAKTPKIVYYSSKAKCMLMENGPDADFQAVFYEGAKLSKNATNVKIADSNGWTSNANINSDGSGLPSSVKLLWDHFKCSMRHCVQVEKTMGEMSRGTSESVFPLVIGKRPGTSNRSLTANKENLSPISAVGAYEGSVISSRRGASSKSRILKRVLIPGIGQAMQLANGVVSVEYSDKSRLSVEPSSSQISYTDSTGRSSHYQKDDVIPQEAREKLTHINKIIQALMNA